MADGAASLPSTPSGVDRLSDLHDDLLHEIITRLPVIEAVHTAVLAKRWRHLWSSSPLVLRDHDLPKPARDALVPRILREHPGPFLSVRLTDCRLGEVGEIPGWPRHLADRRTQKLFLANRVTRTRNQPLPNALPRLAADLLRCRSLQKLSLCFWEFPVDLCRGGISLPHLQQLDLVMIIAGDQDLEDLIAACPVLKTLTLSLINTNRAKHIRFRSPSLRGVLVGLWGAIEEFTVLNAPLLERLLLFLRGNGVRVKIGCAAKLQVLGHLDARAHRLQIYDNAIELNTMMTSTSTVIPSVKMLVVMVNFGVLREVKMLASFLRCFPNIDTLHIKSALQDPSVTANAPRGEHHASSWQDISPVQCLRSHVKKMVIHNFRGLPHEFEFLNFIAMNAQELQSLDVVLQQEAVSSTDMVDEITDKLQFLRLRTGISGVLLVLPKIASDSILHRETGLNRNIDEPFSF